MQCTDEYVELFAYNHWATQRMLDAAASLTETQLLQDLGSSFPSVRDTLVHIMSAEWVWLSRWQGVSPTSMPDQWKPFLLDEIREQWAAIDADMQAFVHNLQDGDLDRLVSYRNIAGEPFTTPLSQMLRHVVNHATYHRGQITTMLRQLGVTPPSTDLIAYYRLAAPALSAG